MYSVQKIEIKKVGKHIKITVFDTMENKCSTILGVAETNQILNQLINISFEITKEYAGL